MSAMSVNKKALYGGLSAVSAVAIGAAVVSAAGPTSGGAQPAGTVVSNPDLSDGVFYGAIQDIHPRGVPGDPGEWRTWAMPSQVQARITVDQGVVTRVEAVNYPRQNRMSRSLSQRAIARIEQYALDAQGDVANWDREEDDTHFVTGATVTSLLFVASIQDALDQSVAR